MARIKVIFSYDGTNFQGYQRQHNYRTVQGEIEKVLSRVFDEEIKFVASGRTDLKVHALYQIAHFDAKRNENLNRMCDVLNHLLPKDIHFKSMEYVDDNFHARISAIRKTYRYIINMGEENPFYQNYRYELHRTLDIDLIKECLNKFVGTKRFRNFTTKEEDYQDFVRTIYDLNLKEEGELVTFEITGSGFMKHMVRMIVGTLVDIGLHKIPSSYIDEAFNTLKNPVNHLVPGSGLYLVNVEYEEGDSI